MDRPIAVIIDQRNERENFRPSFLAGPFATNVTLRDVLKAPETILTHLRVGRGVGEVTVARVRRALVEELQVLAPQAMQQAYRARLQPDQPLPADADPLTESLIRFLKVWNVSDSSYPVAGEFHRSYASATNTIFAAALVGRAPFIYAPESFPEIVKTRDVLRAEQGASEQNGFYAARLEAMREDAVRVPPGSLVLLDRAALENLVACRGVYDALTPAMACEQLALLQAFLPRVPRIDVIVTDFRLHGVSSGFATEDGPLLHHCFGGYLELRTPDLLTDFQLVTRSAAAAGRPLAEWLTALRAEGAGEPADGVRGTVARLFAATGPGAA
jgi:hypothetical protein